MNRPPPRTNCLRDPVEYRSACFGGRTGLRVAPGSRVPVSWARLGHRSLASVLWACAVLRARARFSALWPGSVLTGLAPRALAGRSACLAGFAPRLVAGWSACLTGLAPRLLASWSTYLTGLAPRALDGRSVRVLASSAGLARAPVSSADPACYVYFYPSGFYDL